MKIKKTPMRTCVVTRESYPKNELLRIVRTPEGLVVVDLTGKQNGRGAYIKKEIEVVERAKKTKALERHLQVQINDEVYQEICNVINNN